MIIQCNKCLTKYAVPDNSVGVAGRTVKCAKCGYSWLQIPLNRARVQTKAQKKMESLPKGFAPDKPNLLQKVEGKIFYRQTPLALKIMPFFILTLMFCISLVVYKDSLIDKNDFFKKLYAHLGVHSTHGVNLKDFQLNFVDDEEEKSVEIIGNIINTNPKDQYLPNVNITLISKKTGIVGSEVLEYGNVKIRSSEKIPVYTKIVNSKNEIDTIVLELVDNFDIMFK